MTPVNNAIEAINAMVAPESVGLGMPAAYVGKPEGGLDVEVVRDRAQHGSDLLRLGVSGVLAALEVTGD